MTSLLRVMVLLFCSGVFTGFMLLGSTTAAGQSTANNANKTVIDPVVDALPRALTQTLTRLASKISANAGRVVAYREQRDSELLDAPLNYQGELQFDATTKTLTKTVTSPIDARMILTPTQLTLKRPGKKDRRVKLARRPQLQVLHTGITALFTGDVKTLAETFEIDYQEDADGDWQIGLMPLSKALQRKVVGIVIAGQHDTIATMTTELANGEEQTMTLEQ